MYSIIYWTVWVSHLFVPDIFHLDLFLWGDATIFGQWILRCQTKTKKHFFIRLFIWVIQIKFNY